MQKKLVDAKISCNFASDLRRLIFHINLIEPPICEDRRFFVSSVGAFSFPQLAQVYFIAHLWILNSLANGVFS